MAQSNLKQPMNQTCNVGISHSRSLSQPTFSGNNCLPPLSPFPPTSESSLTSSNSNFKDLSMDDIDVCSRGTTNHPSLSRENLFRGTDSLPPLRGHRRSNSDVPLGFPTMIQSSSQLVPISGPVILDGMVNMREAPRKYNKPIGDAYSEEEVVNDLFNSFMNLENVDALKSSVTNGKDTELESVSRDGQHSREGLKRSAVGDIASPARHCRSLSMDSAIGNFHFGDISPKLQNVLDHFSPSNSMSDNSAKLGVDSEQGEFNEFEMKKIMADERLAEIAVADPKRAKRILANRQSAARSKERKLRYISELEHKVQILQTETTTLSAQVTTLQKDYAELANENNELKFRFQSMEQQAKLRDALHEALNAEVQRLKFANMELGEEGRVSNGISQQVPMRLHMFTLQQQQPNQIQRLSMETSTLSTS